MLEIVIPASEKWDEAKEEFIYGKEQTLRLEHSLVSLSKWETKWCKPFLSSDKSREETIDYIKCMTISSGVDENVYSLLTDQNIEEITKYINAPMTAITFPKSSTTGSSRETVTYELVYYWMITLNIPFECQKWHLNRLLALIRVCNIKNQPPKKMSKGEIMSRNAALNAARRKQLNTKG